MKRLIVPFTILVIGSGCGMKPAPLYTEAGSSAEARLPRIRRDALLGELSLYHGTTYCRGGTGLACVDCSGMVRSIYSALGVRLPRTVIEQYAGGVPVGLKEIKAGDLVFFGASGVPTHVGVALSNRELIHASASRGVVVDSIEGMSRSMDLLGIRRVARIY
jgi:cell wall-associated NlpC family hydrolase